VIRAVADTRNEHPAEMDCCLYDAVDPDALDALLAAGSTDRSGIEDAESSTISAEMPVLSGVSVSFSFGGVRVVVDATGRVFVSDRTDASGTTGASTLEPPVASAGSQ